MGLNNLSAIQGMSAIWDVRYWEASRYNKNDKQPSHSSIFQPTIHQLFFSAKKEASISSNISQGFHLQTRNTLQSRKFFRCRFRSSCPEVFCKKGVPKNLLKFTGKYLCQSIFFLKTFTPKACNYIKKGTLTQLFSYELCKICKNTFSQRTSLVAASVVFIFPIF